MWFLKCLVWHLPNLFRFFQAFSRNWASWALFNTSKLEEFFPWVELGSDCCFVSYQILKNESGLVMQGFFSAKSVQWLLFLLWLGRKTQWQGICQQWTKLSFTTSASKSLKVTSNQIDKFMGFFSVTSVTFLKIIFKHFQRLVLNKEWVLILRQ